MWITGYQSGAAANCASVGKVPEPISMSAGIAVPAWMPAQSIFIDADSAAKVLDVSYAGLPRGSQFWFFDMSAFACPAFNGTESPATLFPLPQASIPLIVGELPLMSMPDRLVQPASTFIVERE